MRKLSDYTWVQLGLGNPESVLRTLHDKPKGSVAAMWSGMTIKADEPNAEPYTFTAMASDDTLDRAREVIAQDGWDMEDYRKAPVILWSHMYSVPAIGQSLSEEIVKGKGLKVRGQLAVGEYDLASLVWRLVAAKVIRGVSVGFIALDWEEGSEDYPDAELVFTKQALLEYSLCNVACNPNALIEMAGCMTGFAEQAKVLFQDMGTPLMEAKGVTPFTDLPIAPEDQRWNPNETPDSELIGAILGPNGDNWERAKNAHFWWDGKGGKQSAYKLKFARMYNSSDPNNVAPKNGTLTAIWKQVASRMAILRGARAGVDIPDEDRKPVYNHIVKYYKKFDKEPPEFRSYTPDEWRILEQGWGFRPGETLEDEGGELENGPEKNGKIYVPSLDFLGALAQVRKSLGLPQKEPKTIEEMVALLRVSCSAI